MTHTPSTGQHSLGTILAYPFWHRSQRRPRLLVRLLLVGMLLFVLQIVMVIVDQVLGLQTPGVTRTLVSTFGAVFIACPLFDRRRYGDLGFHIDRRWWLDLAFGAFLGAMLMAIIFVIEWTMGWITIEKSMPLAQAPDGMVSELAGLLGTFIAVGVSEELMLRGYLLTNLAEGFRVGRINSRTAILLAWLGSSLFFGLLHLGNPNTTWISTANLAFAGLFLGLAYVLTGSLALPIGLHITWNLFQGPVFGFPVSGIAFGETSILRITQYGPPAWTGGAFGPEAGLLGLLANLMGAICIVLWISGMDGDASLHEPLAKPPHGQ